MIQKVLKYSNSKGVVLPFKNGPWHPEIKEYGDLIWKNDDIIACKKKILYYINKLQPEYIYTHNERGEYGHNEHVLTHNMVKDIIPFIKFNVKIFVFNPVLNYNSDDRIEDRTLLQREKNVSNIRQTLLNIYPKDAVKQFYNIIISYKLMKEIKW